MNVIGFNGHNDDINEAIIFANSSMNLTIKIFSIDGISSENKFRFMKYEIDR